MRRLIAPTLDVYRPACGSARRAFPIRGIPPAIGDIAVNHRNLTASELSEVCRQNRDRERLDEIDRYQARAAECAAEGRHDVARQLSENARVLDANF